MSTALPNEVELLQHVIAGDAESFRRIYETYQGKIFLFSLQLTKSKAAAEDVVQEVFVRLWETRHRIDIEKSLNAYLVRIAKNLILDGFKKAAHDKSLQEKIYRNIQTLQKNGIDELIEKELSRLHIQAIERLSPQKKAIFRLSREEQLNYQEIAERLGISRNTVRNQISGALQSIREYLSAHMDIATLIIAWIEAGR